MKNKPTQLNPLDAQLVARARQQREEMAEQGIDEIVVLFNTLVVHGLKVQKNE